MYNVTLARDGTSPVRQDFIKIKKIVKNLLRRYVKLLYNGEINLWCEKLTDDKKNRIFTVAFDSLFSRNRRKATVKI